MTSSYGTVPGVTVREGADRHGVGADGLYYPADDDGEGETQWHTDAVVELRLLLEEYFADRPDVYVGMDLNVFPEAGNPRNVLRPDVFVVFGVPKEPKRRVYQVWEEGVAPSFVVEVASESTVAVDVREKPGRYAAMGVAELVLYDPEGGYLQPRLQGLRLVGGAYQPMAEDERGELVSEQTGLSLFLDEAGRLRLRERRTGRVLPTRAERLAAAEARVQEAEARLQQEAERRRRLEQEVAELRARLEDRP